MRSNLRLNPQKSVKCVTEFIKLSEKRAGLLDHTLVNYYLIVTGERIENCPH